MENTSVQINVAGLTDSILKIVREPTVHKVIAIQEHDIKSLTNSIIRITFEIKNKSET